MSGLIRRGLLAADLAASQAAQNVDLASSAAGKGAGLLGFCQRLFAAAARTVESKLADTVSVFDFFTPAQIADVRAGTLTLDVTAAIQAATNSGQQIYFPVGAYKMLSAVTYAGPVTWIGAGSQTRLVNDSHVLINTNCSGSTVGNMRLDNLTAPFIMIRDPSNWASVAPIQSNGLGYQPTPADAEWSGLSVAIQNQDISPRLIFDGGATGATGVSVSNIFGRFALITLYDCSSSTVSGCIYQAGKGTSGSVTPAPGGAPNYKFPCAGIAFINRNVQGQNNKAIGNTITLASYNGIIFTGNNGGQAVGNTTSRCGESGIKTAPKLASITWPVNDNCTNMLIVNNTAEFNYADGFDVSSTISGITPSTVAVHLTLQGNTSRGNRGAGFYGDGSFAAIAGNRAYANAKAGFALCFSYAAFSANHSNYNNVGNQTVGFNYSSNCGEFYLELTFSSISNNVALHETAGNGDCYWIQPGSNSTFTDNFKFGTNATWTLNGVAATLLYSSGNLLLGRINDAGARLQVESTIDSVATVAQFRNSSPTVSKQYGIAVTLQGTPNNSSQYLQRWDDTAGTMERATLLSNGGLANYSANNTNLSDVRMKKDFAPAPSYYARWRHIDFVNFRYKDQTDELMNLGVTAQGLESICPELVDSGGFGSTPPGEPPLKSVYQTDFQYATGKALQEAIEQIEILKGRLDVQHNGAQ